MDVDVILINKKLPDMEFNALLKANRKRLHYIMGTVFDNGDLEKTVVQKVLKTFYSTGKRALQLKCTVGQ